MGLGNRNAFHHRANILETSNDLSSLKLGDLTLALTTITLSEGLIRNDLDGLVSELIRAEPISISVVRESAVVDEVLDDEQVSVLGSDMQGRVPESLSLLIDVLAFA